MLCTATGFTGRASELHIEFRWTPRPVVVSVRDSRDNATVLLYIYIYIFPIYIYIYHNYRAGGLPNIQNSELGLTVQGSVPSETQNKGFQTQGAPKTILIMYSQGPLTYSTRSIGNPQEFLQKTTPTTYMSRMPLILPRAGFTLETLQGVFNMFRLMNGNVG